MKLEETIRSKTAKEKGLAFVNSNGKRIGEFPVDEKGGNSFTSDVEIMRGELAQIFYDASKDTTKYIFGDYVTTIDDSGQKVKTTFSSGAESEFDLVIGADGMRSKTRRITFPPVDPIKPLGQYTAFFTIPEIELKGDFAEWYNAPGGRCVFLRPGDQDTRAYLSVISSKPKGYEKFSIPEQKNMIRDIFKDAGWKTSLVLDGMDATEDFYMQEIAQVKLDSWSKGRVVLIGDAGYCPSPISGMGTSLALVGAYILAGELGRCGGDWKEGLKMYEEKMRPYVRKAQALPPGAPAIANPQSKWGISILNGFIGFVSKSGIVSLFEKFQTPQTEDKSLPVYEM